MSKQPEVKQFVFLSPDGSLALGIPFRYHENPHEIEMTDGMPGYKIFMSDMKPSVWGLQLSDAGFYTMILPEGLKHLENLGEL